MKPILSNDDLSENGNVALDGRAALIFTGDLDLLDLHPFHGIDIVTPARFLERAAG
jgi:predicted nucleic acid-binding protein